MTVTTVDKMVSRLAQKVNRDLFYGCADNLQCFFFFFFVILCGKRKQFDSPGDVALGCIDCFHRYGLPSREHSGNRIMMKSHWLHFILSPCVNMQLLGAKLRILFLVLYSNLFKFIKVSSLSVTCVPVPFLLYRI